jgi:hypothetical protein
MDDTMRLLIWTTGRENEESCPYSFSLIEENKVKQQAVQDHNLCELCLCPPQMRVGPDCRCSLVYLAKSILVA